MTTSIVKNIILGFVLGSTGFSALASESRPSPSNCRMGLDQFLVFSLGDISAELSDFQGITGAGGSVTLRHFLIGFADAPTHSLPRTCAALIAGESVRLLTGGQIQGPVIASDIRRDRSFSVTGQMTRLSNSTSSEQSGHLAWLESLKREALSRESELMKLSPNSPAQLVSGQYLVRSSRPGGGVNVVDLDGRLLDPSAQPVRAWGIDIQGSPRDQFIIRVRSVTTAVLYRMRILPNALRPDQITWLFPESSRVFLGFTGSQPLGIPGRILAPRAEVRTESVLITGQIIAGSWVGGEPLDDRIEAHGGQVNVPTVPSTPRPPSPPAQ